MPAFWQKKKNSSTGMVFDSLKTTLQWRIEQKQCGILFFLYVYSMMKILTAIFFSLIYSFCAAQRLPDKVYMGSIKTIKFFPKNNQQAIPIIQLNAVEQLELHFDDLVNYPKNYFYTYELCNADWSIAQWSPFDYIKGFQQNRISQYRVSSIAKTQYIHYQALLPDQNSVPTRSGNYILKVFQDGDTAKLLFTKRFYVVENKISISAALQQPFNFQITSTHQKIQLALNTEKLNMIGHQQIKTIMLQNNRWDFAIECVSPAFIRGNILTYNAEEDGIFPGGKEYRWIDLQSLRFQSDRVESVDRTSVPFEVRVKTDMARNGLRYLWYRDLNGFNEIRNSESINPWWQSDYAMVNFRFAPDKGIPYLGKQVYLMGELTGNQLGDTSRMEFDAVERVYTKKVLLKQGYYSYVYATKEMGNQGIIINQTVTEGNYWETENDYTILVYYRPIGGRHDELIGYKLLNTLPSTSLF